MINEVRKEFGPFYALIAHSFGGLSSLIALRDSVNIEKMVLISSLASPLTAIHSFTKIFNLPEYIDIGIIKNIEKRFGKPFNHYLVDDLSYLENVDSLIIHDKFDLIVPVKDSLYLKGRLPNSKLLITENLGHHKILSNPQIVETVTSFLS